MIFNLIQEAKLWWREDRRNKVEGVTQYNSLCVSGGLAGCMLIAKTILLASTALSAPHLSFFTSNAFANSCHFLTLLFSFFSSLPLTHHEVIMVRVQEEFCQLFVLDWKNKIINISNIHKYIYKSTIPIHYYTHYFTVCISPWLCDWMMLWKQFNRTMHAGRIKMVQACACHDSHNVHWHASYAHTHTDK